MRRLWLI